MIQSSLLLCLIARKRSVDSEEFSESDSVSESVENVLSMLIVSTLLLFDFSTVFCGFLEGNSCFFGDENNVFIDPRDCAERNIRNFDL